MISSVAYADDLNLKATELKLGLPGTEESGYRNNKRPWPVDDSGSHCTSDNKHRETAPVTKAQVVGWPPIRSYRKNSFHAREKSSELAAAENGIYVKVSVDGAPYLRKIDLKVYKGYQDLLKCLENMFKLSIGEYSDKEGYMGSEYAPAYEDKDGDWMLVGDVPWDMFMSSCKRLRIMKGSEARGSSCGI